MAGCDFDPARFAEKPVLGIIRGLTEAHLTGVLDAVVQSGVGFVEITLNTPDALSLLESAAKEFSEELCIGAGTVLSARDAENAAAAGARFLVSPTAKPDVSRFCLEKKIPYFPGAFTPTEIETAWNAGAFMVKVFPSSILGPGYFREVKGPFQDIRLMAVGGVRASNVTEFLRNGASAVAVGASVFSQERMKGGDHTAIQKDLEEILVEVGSFLHKIE